MAAVRLRACACVDLRYRAIIRRLTGLAVRHPELIVPLLTAAWHFRARDWYRRAPFLPVPPADYIEWRLHTAYGDTEVVPTSDELARYLRWTSRMRKRDRPDARR